MHINKNESIKKKCTKITKNFKTHTKTHVLNTVKDRKYSHIKGVHSCSSQELPDKVLDPMGGYFPVSVVTGVTPESDDLNA